MHAPLNARSIVSKWTAALVVCVVEIYFPHNLNAADPWPGMAFATVRAFAWPADQDQASVVLADMTPRAGAVDPKGRLLSSAQVGKLIAAATRKRAPGRLSLSICFEPHHAFIFYDTAGRPVAFFEVCLHYHGYRLAPELSDLEPHYGDLASLCAELKLPFPKDFSLVDYRRRFDDTYVNGAGFEGAD